jgi:hypothetical protein
MPPIDDGELDEGSGLQGGEGGGFDVGGAADVLPSIQPELPPDIDATMAVAAASRMNGRSALASKAASNRDRITKLLSKHFERREAPTAEFADVGAAAGAALRGTPYSLARQQVDQSNQRADIALGSAQGALDDRALAREDKAAAFNAANLGRAIQMGQLAQRQVDQAARAGDRRANMLRRTVMDLAKTTDDPLTASSLAFAAVAEADAKGLVLPQSWQADVAKVAVDAITKAGIKSKPKADRSTEFDRLVGELTDPADIAAAKRIKLRLQPGAQGPVAGVDAQGNPIVIDKNTATSRYVTPKQQGQVAQAPLAGAGQPTSPPPGSAPSQVPPMPKKVAEDAQKAMVELSHSIREFDRVSQSLQKAGPEAVGIIGAGIDILGGLYNQAAPYFGMSPSEQVSHIKAFRSSVQPLVSGIARVLNGPGVLTKQDVERGHQATRILESSSDFGSIALALQTLQDVFRKKYESVKALSGPGGQAIEGVLGAPSTGATPGTWSDGEFEYRRTPNGGVQRRRLQ